MLTVGAAVAGATRGYSTDARVEFEETSASAFEALGQKTCLREAHAGTSTAQCPIVPVPTYPGAGATSPVEGTLVLDSFYATHVGLTPPGALLLDTQAVIEDLLTDPTAPNPGAFPAQGNNLRRDSEGYLPDVILPGVGQVRAWHGWWADKNSNGIIEAWLTGERSLDDEWHSKMAAALAAYVDPGAHPDWRSLDPPGDSSPDFWYARSVAAHYTYYQNGLQHTNFILFTDGSLFQSVSIRSVTDPILAPNEDGTEPYRTTPSSLLDIDVYTALASGPVEGLYEATLAPIVNDVGSPSLGICPGGCRPGVVSPRDAGFEELEPFVAPVSSELYAPYPREWQVGEGSTSSGRHDDHVAFYTPWIDLIPTWGYRNTAYLDPFYFLRGGPLPGKTADDRQAMLPGFLSFEIRTGLWRDLDGDGYVGSGGSNAYHGGTRPLPDDYLDPHGEYFGLFAEEGYASNSRAFQITLIPDTTWGPGVLAQEDVSFSGDGEPITCVSEGGRHVCVGEPVLGIYVGDENIQVNARRDVVGASAGDDRTPGLYRSGSVFFPFGTDGFGFTACTDVLTLRYESATGAVEAPLKDCDWIGPLASGDRQRIDG